MHVCSCGVCETLLPETVLTYLFISWLAIVTEWNAPTGTVSTELSNWTAMMGEDRNKIAV